MSDVDVQYDQMMRGEKTLEVDPAMRMLFPEGTVWKLLAESDGRPFIKATCSRCHSSQTQENLRDTFFHCGRRDSVPADIVERFTARKGKKQGLLQRILKPAPPVPNY